MKESLNWPQICTAQFKCLAYVEISAILMEQGNEKESFRLASEIKVDSIIREGLRFKAMAYANISEVLFKKGKNEQSKEAMKKSLKVASKILDEGFCKESAC